MGWRTGTGSENCVPLRSKGMPSIAALRRILLPGDIGDMGDEGDEGVGPLALELGSRSSALGEGTRPGMRPGEIGETETLRSTCWA